MIKPDKILLLGFAREGAASLIYFKKKYPGCKFDIYDQRRLEEMEGKWQKILQNDSSLGLYLGQKNLQLLNVNPTDYDLIIKTAGIPNKDIPNNYRPKITTQTNIFFDNCPGKIIGITGSKGKSTTSSLIYEILKTAGRRCVYVGNIGKPCLEFLADIDKDTLVVFEISSHQLSTLKKSPHIAVFLNIYAEHLDYYADFNEYFEAKTAIAKYQTERDYFIYNGGFSEIKKLAKNVKSQTTDYRLLTKDPKGITTKLQGKFNLNNIKAAWAVGRILKIDESVIEKAVQNFSPLKHRLELVGRRYRGITFYNDSLATIPEATIAALSTFIDQIDTLITGGYDRGLSYKKLADKLLQSRIRNLIIFPTTGDKIVKELEALGTVKRFKIIRVNNMPDAVRYAYQLTAKNKIAMLSCASSSFNLFKDYEDRGEQFKKNVIEMGVR